MPLGKSCFRSIKIIHNGKDVQPPDRICSLRKVTQQVWFWFSQTQELSKRPQQLLKGNSNTRSSDAISCFLLSCSYLSPNDLHLSTFLMFKCFPPSQKKKTSVDPPGATSQLPFCKSLSDAKTLPATQSSQTHLFTVNSTASWVPYLCSTKHRYWSDLPIPRKVPKSTIGICCVSSCMLNYREWTLMWSPAISQHLRLQHFFLENPSCTCS